MGRGSECPVHPTPFRQPPPATSQDSMLYDNLEDMEMESIASSGGPPALPSSDYYHDDESLSDSDLEPASDPDPLDVAGDFSLTYQKYITSGTIMRAQDLCEVFSPPRVTLTARRAGLTADFAFDITYNGWDALNPRMRTELFHLIRAMDPKVLILSPPCTMFSPLTRHVCCFHRNT